MSKKKYLAPLVVFNDLSLSTGIGSDCMIKSRHAENMCAIVIEDYPYSLINREFCESYAPEITDGICYHVPLADANVFTS